jgi:hypothetical protein
MLRGAPFFYFVIARFMRATHFCGPIGSPGSRCFARPGDDELAKIPEHKA